MRRSIVLALVLVLLAPASSSGSAGSWSWPLGDQRVDRHFDPPADEYGPGHRGIDLPGRVGDAVRSVAAGVVVFAGRVGGVPVISIDHGGERSTYQPVVADVRVGDAVEARQPIGALLGEHSHCESACLHLGRRVGDTYLDPLELLGSGRFRLISPHGDPPPPPTGADGTLVRPVGGPVTSPFGMRVHPVTGVRTLHDGTDFGVPCGTPVHAAAGGVVVSSGVRGAYGLSVMVRHSPGLQTSYSHLSRVSVAVGARLEAGDVVGHVGSTGMSTGCHLHFMVVQDGRPVDPMAAL